MDEIDIEFNEALAVKRHKEILEVFKIISDKIDVSYSSEALIEEVKNVLYSIDASLNDNKNSQILEELKKISNLHSKGWKFIINRDIQGFIEGVDVVSK